MANTCKAIHLMYYFEKYNNNRVSFRYIYTFFFLLITATAVTGYIYYQQITYYFISDVYLRLEENSQKIEAKLSSHNVSHKRVLESIKKFRDLAELNKKNSPLEPLAHYYLGLFYFYELILRIPYNQRSLLDLTGKGFLPQHIPITFLLKKKAILPIVKKVILSMRISLAIKSDFFYSTQAKIILSYATLIFTGRTDLRELRRIRDLEIVEISALLHQIKDWTRLAFYAQLGKIKLLNKQIAEIRTRNKDAKPRTKDNNSINHIELNSAEKSLLLCHALYHAKEFLRSLHYARMIIRKYSKDSKYIYLDAMRMEAEIFYIQRGKLAARHYFEKVLAASKKENDTMLYFIKSRIKEIYFIK